MPAAENPIDVYLETGAKRTFAGALDWPGWSRSGRDEASALEALAAYAPRYARALRGTRLGFRAPADARAFVVAERLPGDTNTDFGVPGRAPAADALPVDAAELRRLQTLLRAAWRALDASAEAAVGAALRKGPRGGGRDLDEIVRHVLDAEIAYLGRLGAPLKRDEAEPLGAAARREREMALETLAAAARGELPAQGPRGGAHWSPRYFVRRAAWHVLDHAWEIEDRAGA